MTHKRLFSIIAFVVMCITLFSTCKKDKNNDPLDLKMVFVKGGTFTMGCTDGECWGDGREEPVHQITLSSYYITKYPITQKLWKKVMENNPSYFKDCDDCPVELISWENAQEFIIKLNELTDKNYRLPTEAEWEYAARGGNQSKGYKYSGSNYIDAVAWYRENSKNRTHPVGGKTPNELGIYDMSGNVWEWCYDWYGAYIEDTQINPQGPAEGSQHVLRGGDWTNGLWNCRVSFRYDIPPGDPIIFSGFRLVIVP